jgi:hypothetical protein
MTRAYFQSAHPNPTRYDVRKPRITPTHEKTYLLDNIPRELMTQAKTKARYNGVPLKWVLINLLEQWVNDERTV